jgi:hypothetical protein
MSAVIVANKLPAEIVALSDEAMAEVQRLTSEARALTVTDAASLEQGNALFRRIDALKKTVEAQRLDITRPIDALKAAIMEAERQATKPLAEARADLGERLLTVQRRLEAERQAAERRAREEAEARARAERERLEAERQAIIRRQAEERARAEAKAREEAELFGVAPEPVEAAPEPPPVVVVPVVERAAVAVPVVPRAAVRESSRPVLVIDDAAKIPRELGGVALLIPDTKAIERILKAGVAVPGCRLENRGGFASAGGR